MCRPPRARSRRARAARRRILLRRRPQAATRSRPPRPRARGARRGGRPTIARCAEETKIGIPGAKRQTVDAAAPTLLLLPPVSRCLQTKTPLLCPLRRVGQAARLLRRVPAVGLTSRTNTRVG